MIDKNSNHAAYEVFLGDRIAGEILTDRRGQINVTMFYKGPFRHARPRLPVIETVYEQESWYNPGRPFGTFSDALEAIVDRAAMYEPDWAALPLTLRETRRMDPKPPAQPGVIQKMLDWLFRAPKEQPS